MPYGYAVGALTIDTGGATVTLDPDYDFTADRVSITFSDDDIFFDGDDGANDVGVDSSQSALVTDMDGNTIASGQVYDEQFHSVSNGTTTIWIEEVEVGGVLVGYIVSEPLDPGTSYTLIETNNVTAGDDDDVADTRITYDAMFSVPCFGPGTHLMTTEGEVPVEWLARGDKVITRDHGAQPIQWIGRYKVTPGQAFANPQLAPLEIAAHALGPGLPTHPMQLSSQHRMLLAGYDVELHTGTDEALAAVTHLEQGGLFERVQPEREFHFTHILLERHEIVLANGLWCESLLLGENADPALMAQIPDALRTGLTLARGHQQAARTCLRRFEVAALLGQSARATLPDLMRATG